jgi:hypothetical protein
MKFSVNDHTATTQAYHLILGMGYNAMAKQCRTGESTVLSILEFIIEATSNAAGPKRSAQVFLMRNAFDDVQAEQGIGYEDRRYATPESKAL